MLWWSGFSDPRCNQFGTTLRPVALEYDYVKHVHCLGCDPTKQPIGTLTILEIFIVCVVEGARTRWKEDLIKEEEVREIVAAEVHGQTENLLAYNIREYSDMKNYERKKNWSMRQWQVR